MFARLKNRKVRYFLGILVIAVLFGSCSGEQGESPALSGEPVVKAGNIDTATIQESLRENSFEPRLTPRELLENFNYCRDNAETDFTCKFYIAKAISDYYGIDDFKKGESFIEYENIRSVVENGDNWLKLGEATDQEVLEKAQVNANNGKATIAINTNDMYGHVVLILKGNLSKAHNWKGLMAPNCASFFMINTMQPFVNKSLGYAFSSPESVYLYTKK